MHINVQGSVASNRKHEHMQDENHLSWFPMISQRTECIAKYRQVVDVSVVISKSDIVTRDFVPQVTMSR